MSPAPAEEVVLDCNYELEFGGSLKKKQKTTELKGEGAFWPKPENGVLRRDAITTISQEVK